MEVILFVTSLWQGAPQDPRNTIHLHMKSMAECENEAAEWHKTFPKKVTTLCVEQKSFDSDKPPTHKKFSSNTYYPVE